MVLPLLLAFETKHVRFLGSDEGRLVWEDNGDFLNSYLEFIHWL